MSTMGKGEREDLQRLIRQREKVQTTAAKQRSADILADFESQMASQFSFDDDAVWADARKAAEREVEKARNQIAARCLELGIPKAFAPTIGAFWSCRGYSNSVEERRKELRRVAQSQVLALERKALVQIQQASIEAQTEIAVAGLTSDAARAFVAKLPAVESLMPALSYEELAGEADPPIVEQLITPNALRQRAYRDRQRALRDGSVTQRVTNASVADEDDGSGDGGEGTP